MSQAINHSNYEANRNNNIYCIKLNSAVLVLLIYSLIAGKYMSDCEFATYNYNLVFFLFIFLPSFILRIVTHLFVKNEVKYVNLVGIVEFNNFFIYGIFVLYTLFKFFPSEGNCFSNISLNVVTFILIIVGGLQAASAIAILTGIFIFCLPCILFSYCKDRRQQNQDKQFRAQVIKRLIKKKFDKQKFMNESECAICLCEFKEDQEVTPLPCDIRHYFHTECIKNWLKEKTKCPLCNKEIKEDDMKQQKIELERLSLRAEREMNPNLQRKS